MKQCQLCIVRFLLNAILLTITSSDIYSLWSSEHLDDLIMSDAYRDSVPASQPAIIGLYQSECEHLLYRTGFTDRGLPPPTQLLIAKYDRTKSHTDTWYNFDESQWDLFTRYNISTDAPFESWCPTIIFQPAEWSEPPVIYHPDTDGSFAEWAWNMLEVNVTFTNDMPTKVYILLEPPNNINDIKNLEIEPILAEIEPEESIEIPLHVSDVIVISNAEHPVISRISIEAVNSHINIDGVNINENVLNGQKFHQNLNDNVAFRKQRIWMTRRRYLFNTQVPPIVPHFTEIGFDHRPMPEELCTYLTQFYEQNKDRARKESFPTDNPLINAHEIPMHMIHIPSDKKRWIAEVIKPLLEEWTGQKLRFNNLYGLREYSKGAVLKGHCDKLQTHVVSTILHLRHDPIDVPWPIEVYGFDKERHYVEDAPCTMTFYESATLIHGRPSTYNGTSWVNAFLHFKPLEWNYQFTRDNFVITPTLKMPIYDPNRYG